MVNSNKDQERPWICCQIGSREHYAIPRVLHRENKLALLLTDFWSRRPGVLSAVPVTGVRKLAERRHDDLATAEVYDTGFSRVLFDLAARRKKWSLWETTFRRDDWFQEQVLRVLERRYRAQLAREPGVFFAYSYAARRLLKFFRELGWTTILGQIDPGIVEENLVAEEVRRNPDLRTRWERAPAGYWANWREELELADRIAVNSVWSRNALIETGVSEEKIAVLPLAYERPVKPVSGKAYPREFSAKRPMRVLFLGQVNLRKGVRILFEAAEKLKGEPIEFWMVGPTDLVVPERFRSSPQFRWVGPVSRSESQRFYSEADLFLLPTLSDGFALTQLEAQAHALPVIASKFCGDVVEDGRNGVLLDPLSGDRLAEVLRVLCEEPERLARLSAESRIDERFSLESLGQNLRELAEPVSV